jgi:hypothetical protein
MTVFHSFDRRRFLQSVTAAGLGACVAPRLVGAQEQGPGHRFVFAYFEGGWDLLLGLDPRDPEGNDPSVTGIDPAYERLPAPYAGRGVQVASNGLRFGPAVPASFLAHAQDMTIVNGVGMDTAAHEVGRRYFLTGRFPRGLTAVGSSAPAEIAAVQGDLTPIPNLSAGVEAYAQDLPNHASPFQMGSLSDLLFALTPLVAVDPRVLAAVEGFHAGGPSCAARRLDGTGLVSAMEDNRARARGYVEDQLAALFDIGRADPEMDVLRQRYDITSASPLDGPEVLAFVAGQAIKNDISQCVSLRVARGLDTHSGWAQAHPPALEQGFAALASLITDLKATPLPEDPTRSVFDVTTILAFSEFGRTPLINALDGRDHHLGNSCLLAGAGIRTGATVGASASVGMLPVAVDPVTGVGIDRPTDAQLGSGAAVVMSPAHILTTLCASAGVPTDVLRSSPIPALLA